MTKAGGDGVVETEGTARFSGLNVDQRVKLAIQLFFQYHVMVPVHITSLYLIYSISGG